MATNTQTSKVRTERYQLISGKHASGKFADDGTEIVNVPGDWLSLTEAQAKSFGNKVKSERVLKAELASFKAQEELFREIDEANRELEGEDDTNEPKPAEGVDGAEGNKQQNPTVTTGVTAPSTATQTTGAVGKPDPAPQAAAGQTGKK